MQEDPVIQGESKDPGKGASVYENRASVDAARQHLMFTSIVAAFLYGPKMQDKKKESKKGLMFDLFTRTAYFI